MIIHYNIIKNKHYTYYKNIILFSCLLENSKINFQLTILSYPETSRPIITGLIIINLPKGQIKILSNELELFCIQHLQFVSIRNHIFQILRKIKIIVLQSLVLPI